MSRYIQVDDASGRYSGMFYWGNNYWVGSSELCDALDDPHATRHHASQSAFLYYRFCFFAFFLHITEILYNHGIGRT
ncbi:hypothetical protein EVAR_17822_1 [Eumeta japonica]|uniref:Uncharacterized protein n=1 Tax=Eumeta variegata TaxID=151549 RepID=A0A4C1TU61_EUMVA|nr:hypothetical protein EVAR_17822_1 [Eumeta japonica]